MTVPVASVTMHPNFRQGAYFNYDFAILKLEYPIDFAQYSWVRPACLPSVGRDMHQDQVGTVTGWGWTNPDHSSQSKVLQSVSVDIMSHDQCVDHYSDNEITDNMLCAMSPGADACFGDSGGPMTVEHRGRRVLVGVVSWGRECARSQWPGVYSRVDTVLDWIRDNTRYAQWCSAPAPTVSRGDRRAGWFL